MSGGSSLKDTDFSNDTDLSGIEDDQSMFLVTHVLKEAFFFFFFFFVSFGYSEWACAQQTFETKENGAKRSRRSRN